MGTENRTPWDAMLRVGSGVFGAWNWGLWVWGEGCSSRVKSGQVG